VTRDHVRLPRWLVYSVILLLAILALERFIYEDLPIYWPVNDLTPVWVSSKAFAAGNDPYNDIPELEKIWASTHVQAYGYTNYEGILHTHPMGYPLMTLPLFAPLTLLSYFAAVQVVLWGSIALFVVMIFLLARQATWSRPRKFFFIAFALAMGPLHNGIHFSNLNTLVIALLGLGVVFFERKPRWAGIALGCALCIKPQVAFLFFAYPWLRRKWETSLSELATAGTILSGAWIWMAAHHVGWYRSYLAALAQFSSTGNNSFYASVRFQMLNLQVLVFEFIHSYQWSDRIAWILFLGLSATAVVLVRKWGRNEAAEWAILSILTLLPVYQRFYTGEILIFTLYWAIENWSLQKAKAAIVLMLPLLLARAANARTITAPSRWVKSHNSDSHFLWNAFVMPHLIWMELILLIILLVSVYSLGTDEIASRFVPKRGEREP